MTEKRCCLGRSGLLSYAAASSECGGATNKTLDFGEMFNTLRISPTSATAAGLSVLPSDVAGPVAPNTPTASGQVIPAAGFFLSPGDPTMVIRMQARFRYLAVKVFCAGDVSMLIEAYNT